MKLTLLAVGRLPARAPEAQLTADYLARATATGRALGLGPAELQEVEARRPGKAAEAELILQAVGAAPGARLIACDEHGEGWTSRRLAEQVGRWRDDGVRRLFVVIGGADGLGADALGRADLRLAFGALTWPHALARAMLAEQLYRTTTLLAGSPYHRD